MGLLILLFICHWAGDYTHLSRPSMLAAKKFGTPLLPIFLHALLHAVIMGIAIEIYLNMTDLEYETFNGKYSRVDTCFLIMLCSHFIIDVMKGKVNYWYPKLQNPANYFHWYVFGLDQFLHTLVIIWIWTLIQ